MRHIEPTWTCDAGERPIHVIATERAHGDLAVSQPSSVVEGRRRAIVDAPWVWLNQVHGAEVVSASSAGQHAGSHADAVVTSTSGVPIAVHTADCAPVALVDPAGVVGVAHVGWRGLVAGVLNETAAAMTRLGALTPIAVLGPCIRAQSYEFGQQELDEVARVVGDSVRATTAWGTDALDLPEGIRSVLAGLGIEIEVDLGGCTASDAGRRWSHRARAEGQRQALVAWIQ